MYANWREAMQDSLYAEHGFYLRAAGPAATFRTSAHDNDIFASAVAALLTRVDQALGCPDRIDLVDVGSGHGELLTGVLAALPSATAARVHAIGVDVAARPAGLADEILWQRTIPNCRGLLVANEWLDVVPVNVLELHGDGSLREVAVDDDGQESIGRAADAADAAWVRRWWPLTRVGQRAEVGLDRDAAWTAAVGRVDRGLAVCVDYGHDRSNRPSASLIGYREGRATRPRPDRSMDLTAHVAFDSVAESGSLGYERLFQRDVLDLLIDRPTVRGLTGLEKLSRHRMLTDWAGLGSHGWLLQPVGVDLEQILRPEQNRVRSDLQGCSKATSPLEHT